MNLKKGDTIGVISQSWCGPEFFPKVHEKGVENLEKMGFKVKEFPFTRKQGSPKERAEDLTAAFLDSEVDAIICSIGGDDCTFLMKHLDIELLQKHKKPIMGYSDPTALFVYFTQHGIPCYYGPSTMAGFSHIHFYPEWLRYTKNMLVGQTMPLIPFSHYNDSYKDWSNGVIELNEVKTNNGFNFLNKRTGKGKLFGGCIESIDWLRGTPYFPEKSFFEDKVLFLETSEDKPTPTQVKYMLRSLGYMNVLQRIKGLLFGRARDYNDKEKNDLEEVILTVLKEFSLEMPVVTNMDFGHTNPQLILEYGKEIKITENSIEYVN